MFFLPQIGKALGSTSLQKFFFKQRFFPDSAFFAFSASVVLLTEDREHRRLVWLLSALILNSVSFWLSLLIEASEQG